MYLHHASVFDYRRYQADMQPLVKEVDEDNLEPLRIRTCEAIRHLQQEWPLEDLGITVWENGRDKHVLTQRWPFLEHSGEGLPREEQVRSQIDPGPTDIAEWFVLVLAEYADSRVYRVDGYGTLQGALTVLGWDPHDTELLFSGLPVYRLLKPEVLEEPPLHLERLTPYWYWARVVLGRTSGWLPIEEIRRFLQKLGQENTSKQVRLFDVCRLPFPGVDFENQVVVKDYNEWLQSAYETTITMLTSAANSGQGLFMTIRFQ
ncbi:MAG: hypothetical protein JW704_09225 [Anaerolineaceae bacterium]|nr:hypothetical protein [Anaerolineaceae bacterium]